MVSNHLAPHRSQSYHMANIKMTYLFVMQAHLMPVGKIHTVCVRESLKIRIKMQQ